MFRVIGNSLNLADSDPSTQVVNMTDQVETPPRTSPERRQYLRVQDAVGLQVQRLADMPAAGQPVPSSARVPVRKRDKYDIKGYAVVRSDYPDVASYIDNLEERIRELLLGGEPASAKPTHKVSLSAGGLRFSDRTLLQPGEMVGITLTLFPSGRRIGTDAVIMSGNDAPEVARGDEPTYRAQFVRMSDADRDAVDEHVRRLLGMRVTFED
ncbi:PilZ domain-containing protein [Granulosicoccus antarcticus]|uniref:PilZ domain-containing protein n=1 Tax=Granulosicoccus antarcticus IMCC3135 TaxID=1192854 RepID=A0A2Z2P1L3_9GAMM|nr:PilZ domain-containing protein [Granulosicoccus antarcticus]ASJ75150.1 hypothetical protein IMCC3135_25435 [Granulosicoccus antarcticus IMCC3135]